MSVTTVANSHPGLSCVEANGVLASNYTHRLHFSSGFPISQGPITYFSSERAKKAKKQWLSSRTIALAATKDSVLLDKELEFKPAFEDYLKALESVKTGVDKAQKNRNQSRSRSRKPSQKREGENGGLGKIEDRFLGERAKSPKRNDELCSKEKKGKRDDSHNVEGRGIVKDYRKKKLSGRRIEASVENDSDDDSLVEERAAFNSLESFNDAVCDQPRVSRLDMEVRIQGLAKWLNDAHTDIPEWIFSKMIRSARIKFADHSILRLIQILGKYGNWRRVLHVIEWIRSGERFKSYNLRYIYTAALDALGKARRPVEALNVFHAMQQHMSSYPDLVAYHSIAVTLGQAGHMKELFNVIESMRSPPPEKLLTGVLQNWDPRLEPDIVVYNAVLNACVRRKNSDGAFWVLQQLKQQNLEASSTTYGLVMEVMLACGKYDLVYDYFRKLKTSSIPNALTYKVLLNTMWKEGKVDEAVQAIQEMETRGVIGSAGLYYDLARCLCSAGRCQEALKQVDKICKVADKPLVVTYTGLIQACLDSGYIENGHYIFNHMQKFCSPNLVTYNIMLKGYLDHEMFEEAKKLFLRLLENSDRVKTKVDYRDIVLPDIHTFNLMLNACSVKHQWDDFQYFYTRMLQHGYSFNAKRHLRMILDALKAGKLELLETTWKNILTENQEPPSIFVKEMFRMKLEQDDFTAALSCVAALPTSESHTFSRKSWLQFFKDNEHLSREETLVRLIDEISTVIATTDSPNITFQNLLTSCKEVLRIQ